MKTHYACHEHQNLSLVLFCSLLSCDKLGEGDDPAVRAQMKHPLIGGLGLVWRAATAAGTIELPPQ